MSSSSQVIINYLIEVFHSRNSIGTITSNNSSSSTYRRLIPTSFRTLPTNILVKIFRYLDEDELRKISLVCQRWRYASLHPTLWKKLKVEVGQDISTNDICFQINRFQQLDTVDLAALEEPVAVIRQICRCIPNLKHFAMKHCRKISETNLRNLLHACKRLESIDLQGTEFSGHSFFEELSRLKYLRRLNFNENPKFTVKNFLTVVLNCHGLEELQVNKIAQQKGEKHLSDKDVSLMVANMSDSLQCIVLDTSCLGNPTFQELFQCPKLETIGLYRATNISGETFANLWHKLSKVGHLTVTHAHQLKGEHVAALFSKGREIMKYLEVLDLTGCWMITDEGFNAIADGCPLLVRLTLKGCKSLKDISQLFSKCEFLEDVNVAFCKGLDVGTLLPLPGNLKSFIVDESEKFAEIVKNIKNMKNIKVYLCLSEYNNKMKVFC